jgi:hypothetical protein
MPAKYDKGMKGIRKRNPVYSDMEDYDSQREKERMLREQLRREMYEGINKGKKGKNAWPWPWTPGV